jgi:VIT1/CCC1 family predicted Fe2+/Mn2+ transporter
MALSLTFAARYGGAMTEATHAHEPHAGGLAGRLNWLRAGVLGANDGIVSVAAIVVGVAGATNDLAAIATAATAALVGGAISMALGEYVSVSSQRDSQRALIAKEGAELDAEPEVELAELTELYERKGLSPSTAKLVASELTEKDALAAHLEIELGIRAEDVVSPWAAAGASALAFVVGGIIPFLATFLPASVRIGGVFGVVVLALAITGALGARLGGSPAPRATVRVVVGGILALAATFLIGRLLGTTGIV